jgi:hypothetical protein
VDISILHFGTWYSVSASRETVISTVAASVLGRAGMTCVWSVSFLDGKDCWIADLYSLFTFWVMDKSLVLDGKGSASGAWRVACVCGCWLAALWIFLVGLGVVLGRMGLFGWVDVCCIRTRIRV